MHSVNLNQFPEADYTPNDIGPSKKISKKAWEKFEDWERREDIRNDEIF